MPLCGPRKSAATVCIKIATDTVFYDFLTCCVQSASRDVRVEPENIVMRFRWLRRKVVTQSKVDREPWADLPVVLNPWGQLEHVEVLAVGVGRIGRKLCRSLSVCSRSKAQKHIGHRVSCPGSIEREFGRRKIVYIASKPTNIGADANRVPVSDY